MAGLNCVHFPKVLKAPSKQRLLFLLEQNEDSEITTSKRTNQYLGKSNLGPATSRSSCMNKALTIIRPCASGLASSPDFPAFLGCKVWGRGYFWAQIGKNGTLIARVRLGCHSFTLIRVEHTICASEASV